MKELLFIGILAMCLVNLMRMCVYLLTSDAYTLNSAKQSRNRTRWHLPYVSVIIPAHNEEKTIERALDSLFMSNYPSAKLEVIIVNDGSTDQTRHMVQEFKRIHKGRCKFRLINRANKGKAAALNYALRRVVRNNLVMCLDADSCLERNALRHAVQYFRDRDVVALSSNVNIVEDGTILALAQRFEYLVCYQMKKGQALLNVEYIVGGIGSMFRKRMMEKVEYYDTNTMTEDIDLTMKIILHKSKKQRIAYAANSVVYTEPAHTLKELMSQRFRWKYGRSQTFLKHASLFFSRNERNSRRLSWFMLPFSLLQDVMFFFEPLILGYFMFITLRYGDTATFSSALIILTVYLLYNVWSSDHLSFRERLRLTYYAPPMYFLMYILSFAEYFALMKALVLSPKLRESIKKRHTTWISPGRKNLEATALNL